MDISEDETDMVVDTETLLLCRLCVRNNGKFQIGPQMQMNINKIFDIPINSYDGMSQIICIECKKYISDVLRTKESYKVNQEKLNIRRQKISKNDTSDLPVFGNSCLNVSSTSISDMLTMSRASTPNSGRSSVVDSVATADFIARPPPVRVPTTQETLHKFWSVDTTKSNIAISPMMTHSVAQETPIITAAASIATNNNTTNNRTRRSTQLQLLLNDKTKVTTTPIKCPGPKSKRRVAVKSTAANTSVFATSMFAEKIEVLFDLKNNDNEVIKIKTEKIETPSFEDVAKTEMEEMKGDAKYLINNVETNIADNVTDNECNDEPMDQDDMGNSSAPPSVHNDSEEDEENGNETVEAPTEKENVEIPVEKESEEEEVTTRYDTRNAKKYNCTFCVKVTLDGTQLKRHIHTHHAGLLKKLKALTVPCSVRMKNISPTTLPEDWVHFDSTKVYHYNPKDMYFFISKQRKNNLNPAVFNSSTEDEAEEEKQPKKFYRRIRQRSKKRMSSPLSSEWTGQDSRSSLSSFRDNEEDSVKSSTDGNRGFRKRVTSNTSASTTTITTNTVNGNPSTEHVASRVTEKDDELVVDYTLSETDNEELDQQKYVISSSEVKAIIDECIQNDNDLVDPTIEDLVTTYSIYNAMWRRTDEVEVSYITVNKDPDEDILVEMPLYKDADRMGKGLGHLKLLQPPASNYSTVTANKQDDTQNKARATVKVYERKNRIKPPTQPTILNGESNNVVSNTGPIIQSVTSAPLIDITKQAVPELPLIRLKEFLKQSDITLVLCRAPNLTLKRLLRLTLKLSVNGVIVDYFTDLLIREDMVFVILVTDKDNVICNVEQWSENHQNLVLKSFKNPTFINNLKVIASRFGKLSAHLLKFTNLLESFT